MNVLKKVFRLLFLIFLILCVSPKLLMGAETLERNVAGFKVTVPAKGHPVTRNGQLHHPGTKEKKLDIRVNLDSHKKVSNASLRKSFSFRDRHFSVQVHRAHYIQKEDRFYGNGYLVHPAIPAKFKAMGIHFDRKGVASIDGISQAADWKIGGILFDVRKASYSPTEGLTFRGVLLTRNRPEIEVTAKGGTDKGLSVRGPSKPYAMHINLHPVYITDIHLEKGRLFCSGYYITGRGKVFFKNRLLKPDGTPDIKVPPPPKQVRKDPPPSRYKKSGSKTASPFILKTSSSSYRVAPSSKKAFRLPSFMRHRGILASRSFSLFPQLVPFSSGLLAQTSQTSIVPGAHNLDPQGPTSGSFPMTQTCAAPDPDGNISGFMTVPAPFERVYVENATLNSDGTVSLDGANMHWQHQYSTASVVPVGRGAAGSSGGATVDYAAFLNDDITLSQANDFMGNSDYFLTSSFNGLGGLKKISILGHEIAGLQVQVNPNEIDYVCQLGLDDQIKLLQLGSMQFFLSIDDFIEIMISERVNTTGFLVDMHVDGLSLGLNTGDGTVITLSEGNGADFLLRLTSDLNYFEFYMKIYVEIPLLGDGEKAPRPTAELSPVPETTTIECVNRAINRCLGIGTATAQGTPSPTSTLKIKPGKSNAAQKARDAANNAQTDAQTKRGSADSARSDANAARENVRTADNSRQDAWAQMKKAENEALKAKAEAENDPENAQKQADFENAERKYRSARDQYVVEDKNTSEKVNEFNNKEQTAKKQEAEAKAAEDRAKELDEKATSMEEDKSESGDGGDALITMDNPSFSFFCSEGNCFSGALTADFTILEFLLLDNANLTVYGANASSWGVSGSVDVGIQIWKFSITGLKDMGFNLNFGAEIYEITLDQQLIDLLVFKAGIDKIALQMNQKAINSNSNSPDTDFLFGISGFLKYWVPFSWHSQDLSILVFGSGDFRVEMGDIPLPPNPNGTSDDFTWDKSFSIFGLTFSGHFTVKRKSDGEGVVSDVYTDTLAQFSGADSSGDTVTISNLMVPQPGSDSEGNYDLTSSTLTQNGTLNGDFSFSLNSPAWGKNISFSLSSQVLNVHGEGGTAYTENPVSITFTGTDNKGNSATCHGTVNLTLEQTSGGWMLEADLAYTDGSQSGATETYYFSSGGQSSGPSWTPGASPSPTPSSSPFPFSSPGPSSSPAPSSSPSPGPSPSPSWWPVPIL